MNPFNWNGPDFLIFYLILATTLIVVQVGLRRMRETGAYAPAQTPRLTDPYLVAYLAGGANALIRCAIVTLLERKVLTVVDGAGKSTTSEVALNARMTGLLQSPFEGAVARLFTRRRPASEVFNEAAATPEVQAVGAQYQASLEGAGLLVNAEQKSASVMTALLVAGILASTAMVKVSLALERGHRNIAFLIVLAIAACITSVVLCRRRLTVPGRAALDDLKQLFGGLKEQTKSGSSARVSPTDVAFVAAVFGLGALGGARQIYAKNLFPAASSSSGSDSSCGSSSSGGDSGGSSCGGGSGCGGCGSS